MFRKFKSELRYPAEFSWLIGLVFFLPLFEAPKNLCWLGYVLTWLCNRFRARDWGGPWDKWDSPAYVTRDRDTPLIGGVLSCPASHNVASHSTQREVVPLLGTTFEEKDRWP